MIELDTSEPIKEIDPAMQRLKDLGPNLMVEYGDVTPFYDEKSRERSLNRLRVAVDRSPGLAPYFQKQLAEAHAASDFFLGKPEHNTRWWRFKQWLRGKLGMKLLRDSRYHWTDEEREAIMAYGREEYRVDDEFATLVGQPDTHDII